MDEPEHKSVVTDKYGVAWQRWHNKWHGVSAQGLQGSAFIKSWQWIVDNRSPLKRMMHDDAQV